MNKKLHEEMEEPLSDSDIMKYLPNAKIIRYPELSNYNNITDLLPYPKSYVIIHMPLENELSGHWISILRPSKKNIEYFCSYGSRPDKQISWIKENLREDLDMKFPHVSKLLNNAIDDGFKVSFNNNKYQNINDLDIATCGRWIVKRILFMLNNKKTTNESDFCKYIENMKEKYNLSNDLLITKLIP